MKRRVLLLLLSAVLVFGMLPMSVAAISTDAQNMATIGILKGAGDGVTDAYLAQDTQRYQLVVLMARMMGKEAQLDQTAANATSFPDARGQSAYVQKVMAFAKANPDLGFIGFDDGNFKPNEIATAQQIYKVLLVVLGYREGIDFNWSQVITLAGHVGMKQLEYKGAITNNDMAVALAEGLRARTVEGSSSLAMKLANLGVIDYNTAVSLGLSASGGSGATGAGAGAPGMAAASRSVPEPAVTAIASVSDPSTTDYIRVIFSAAIPAPLSISIASGTGSADIDRIWFDSTYKEWRVYLKNVSTGTIKLTFARSGYRFVTPTITVSVQGAAATASLPAIAGLSAGFDQEGITAARQTFLTMTTTGATTYYSIKKTTGGPAPQLGETAGSGAYTAAVYVPTYGYSADVAVGPGTYWVVETDASDKIIAGSQVTIGDDDIAAELTIGLTASSSGSEIVTKITAYGFTDQAVDCILITPNIISGSPGSIFIPSDTDELWLFGEDSTSASFIIDVSSEVPQAGYAWTIEVDDDHTGWDPMI